LSAFYALVAAAWVIWVWQRRQDARRQDAEAMETSHTTGKSYAVWVALGMAGPACLVAMFLFALFFSSWPLASKHVPEAEAQRIIAERSDARFAVHQYRGGSSSLLITLPENHRINLATPWNDSLLAALNKKGIAYRTLVEDLDFHNGGVRGWLVLLSTFIVVAGTALLLRRPGTEKFYQQEITTPRAERREKRIAAVCAALAMLVVSLLLIAYTLAHSAQTVSGAEVARIMAEHRNARFDVFQFDDGAKELWITPPGSRRYPAFKAPADESTLTLLAEKHISHQAFVQGRDFGFRGPTRAVSLLCSFVLAMGAASLLWWSIKQRGVLPEPAASGA